ncbi:hypothetical protein FB45DRAFT_923048 [Roridomyces roridus]|uniref:Uncharacterized protein n=1 Tax=Roridomyces roridus TaxID=1738132 RepID=A0AAD7BNK8_9AGAR|nr:hypothetical protein FB45DRAFT_923048 [Roridomyces roridus]
MHLDAFYSLYSLSRMAQHMPYLARQSIGCPAQDNNGSPLTDHHVISQTSQTLLDCIYADGAGECGYILQDDQDLTNGSAACPDLGLAQPTTNSVDSSVPSTPAKTTSTLPAITASASQASLTSPSHANTGSSSSPPNTTPSSADASTSSHSLNPLPQNTHARHLSTGAIIGITFGAVGSLLWIILFVVVYQRQRRRRRPHTDQEAHPDADITPFSPVMAVDLPAEYTDQHSDSAVLDSKSNRPFSGTSVEFPSDEEPSPGSSQESRQRLHAESTRGDDDGLQTQALEARIRTLVEQELHYYLGDHGSPPEYSNDRA